MKFIPKIKLLSQSISWIYYKFRIKNGTPLNHVNIFGAFISRYRLSYPALSFSLRNGFYPRFEWLNGYGCEVEYVFCTNMYYKIYSSKAFSSVCACVCVCIIRKRERVDAKMRWDEMSVRKWTQTRLLNIEIYLSYSHTSIYTRSHIVSCIEILRLHKQIVFNAEYNTIKYTYFVLLLLLLMLMPLPLKLWYNV